MNCFALPDGSFAVTLSPSTAADVSSTDANDETSVRLRWPGLAKVRSAKLFDAEKPDKPLNLRIQKEKDGLSLDLPTVKAGIIFQRSGL